MESVRNQILLVACFSLLATGVIITPFYFLGKDRNEKLKMCVNVCYPYMGNYDYRLEKCVCDKTKEVH
jgi:hypothetical protein